MTLDLGPRIAKPEPQTASGPRGHRFLGSLPAVRKDPAGYFLSVGQTYGDVVRLTFGPRIGHLLRHPDAVKHVLQDNFRNYGKQTRGFITLRETLGQGLLTSEGDFWLRQRRIAQPAFHPQRIAAFGTVMTRATGDMLDRWAATLAPGETIDVAQAMMQLTLRIVGETLLGTDPSAEASDIGAALHTVLHYTIDHVTRFIDLPKAVPTKRNRRYNEALKTLDQVVFRFIADRRAGGTEGNDLLSMLMHARDEETGEGMTDRQLRDEVMTIFLAGHETTANALTWVWYLLSKYPAAAREMEAEIDQVLGGRTPSLQDLSKLTYTKQVFEETLRLYPPAWMIARNALADDEIQGYRIPAGSLAFVSPYVTHRHPDFWENPEGFDPTRFRADAVAARPKFAYFPFGGGPRLCIGRDFALQEAMLIMAMVAQRFRLYLVPGHVVEPEAVVTLRPKHGVRVTVHRR